MAPPGADLLGACSSALAHSGAATPLSPSLRLNPAAGPSTSSASTSASASGGGPCLPGSLQNNSSSLRWRRPGGGGSRTRVGRSIALRVHAAVRDNGAVATEDKVRLVPLSSDVFLGRGEDVNLASASYLMSEGITAVISLETSESLGGRKTSWREQSGILEASGLLSLWIPVLDQDYTNLVYRLPQVVRAVGLLVERGCKVAVLSSANEAGRLKVAPLMGLGYMCFLLGTPEDKALEQIRRAIPGADPPLDPMNLVKEKVKAGEGPRMGQMAEAIYHRRMQTGEPGNSDTDWLQAQEQFVLESFRTSLATDPLLMDAIARTEERVKHGAEGGGQEGAGGGGMPLALGLPWGNEPSPQQLSKSLKAANARLAVMSAELREANDALERSRAEWQQMMRECEALSAQAESLQRKENLYTEALAAANEQTNILTGMLRKIEGGGAALESLAQGQPAETAAAALAAVAASSGGGGAATSSSGGAEAAARIRALEKQAEDAQRRWERADKELQGAKGELRRIMEERDKERQAASALNVELQILFDRVKRAEDQMGAGGGGGAGGAAGARAEAKGMEEELAKARREAAASVQGAEAKVLELEGKVKSAEKERKEMEEKYRQVVEERARLEKEFEARARGARGEAEERLRLSNETVVALRKQNEELEKRLKLAQTAAEASNLRLERIEKQVEEVVQRAAGAKGKEAAASEQISRLNAKVNALEVERDEALRAVARLETERGELQRRREEAEAQARDAELRTKQIREQIVDLKELESSERSRAEDLGRAVTAVQGEQQEVQSAAVEFCDKLLKITKQLAGMNARLAYVEGRQDELGPAWKEALGPAGEIVGDIGPDLAAAAGTRVVEIELKKAPDRKPLELMQVLMDRLLKESGAVAERASRVKGQSGSLQQDIQSSKAKVLDSKSTFDAIQRVKEDSEAAEALLIERALRLERSLLGTRLGLAVAVTAAIGLPAGIFNGTISLDAAYADRIAQFEGQLAEKTMAESTLRGQVAELESDVSASSSTIKKLEGDVQKQRGTIDKLQKLIPLVGPSLASDEADEFCKNVPRRYWTAVTGKFCAILGLAEDVPLTKR